MESKITKEPMHPGKQSVLCTRVLIDSVMGITAQVSKETGSGYLTEKLGVGSQDHLITP